MFKILPKQSFTSSDKATAIVQAQDWLTEQSEGGAFVPLQLDVSGTPGHIHVGGASPTSMIVFARQEPTK